ncbi:MAG: hypothetical protein HOI72_02570 [Candidatus Marinimicrobia bacterium]|nr:hypothetical protein [Candidatus Neomarinimicrobiota bacterium]MBT4827345.1 hypothetical protein [Candidatus Neomarinimicrobiota bacterium]MBT5721057.1 hypothetical protein [Candidatus Neomarinimicrobiota bacterium]MBT6981802.1 hypothetical protein [Candidatus Neomarinimicrobiota bacterium]MBT7374154.1 hypothetical protein [Candidatus Neomarinimicrobiota bacterium]
MKKLPKYFLFLFLGSLYSTNLEPTFLVLNHFDKFLPNADSSLIENFSNSTFEFDSTFQILFEDIDNHENPAASHMVTIKELGEKYQVNYILFNRIEHINDRFILNGLLFNTRSGGLIHRRKIDLKQYLNGQINELNMWVGNTVGQVEKNWENNRKSILFSDPEEINYQKTPRGAAIRSLAAPGWGQAYSGKKISAGLWASTESSLSIAAIISFLNYDKAAKSFKKNSKLYHGTNDEKDVANYRTAAENDWNDHVTFSALAIAFAGATGTGWVANSVHAWIVGPRAYKNLYQKWDPKSPNTTG